MSSIYRLPRFRNDRPSTCFRVPSDENSANRYDLSISRFKEIDHKEIEYEKTEVIEENVMEVEEKNCREHP